MDAVEFLGLGAGQLCALLRDNTKPAFFKPGVDGAGKVAARGIRLDDRQSTFDGHRSGSFNGFSNGFGGRFCGVIDALRMAGKSLPTVLHAEPVKSRR